MPPDISSQTITVQQLQRALRHSEDRLRSLILHNTDGILIIDLQGTVRFANPAAARLLMRPPAELVGQPFGYPIVLGESTEIDVLRAGAQPGSAEMRVMEMAWEGEPAFVATLRDVTERKLAESKIKQLSRANAVLAQVNAAVAHERTQAALFDKVCRMAIEQGEFRLAWIGSVNEADRSARSIVAQAAVGQDHEHLPLWADETWGRLPQIETAIQGRQVEVCNDVQLDEHLRVQAERAGYQSLAAVPLPTQGRVLNILLVYSTQREFFDQAEKSLLEQIGVNISYALENIEREAIHQQMQTALQQSEERFTRVFRAVPEPILISRLSSGLILEANDAAEQLLGYSRAAVIGRSLLDIHLWAEPIEYKLFVGRLQDKGYYHNLATSFRTATGATVPMLVSGCIVELDGRPCIISVGRDISEHRRMEEALRAGRERYRTLIQNVPIAIYRTTPGPHGSFLMVNPTFCTMLGYTEQELRQATVADIYQDPSERQEFSDHLLRAGRATHVEVRLRRKDGSLFWGSVNAQVVQLETDEVAYFDCTMEDITARKQAEAAEREQRALAEALHDTATALSSTLNLDEVLDRVLENVGKIVPYDNASVLLIEGAYAQCVRLRGYVEPGAEVNIMALRLPVDQTEDLRYVAESGQALAVANVHEYSAWSALPGLGWIHSHLSAPLRIKGRTVGFLNLDSAQIDFFTERHAAHLRTFADQAAVALENAQLYDRVQRYAEELEARVNERTAELDRERQRLQAILDTAGEGILFTDRQGKIEYLNPAMERLTGYSSAEALGQDPSSWHSSRTPETVPAEMWRAILRGEVWHGETVNQRKDGTLYDSALIVAPLICGENLICGFVAIARDITRQKELDRLKDQFVANVSHELRTPLTNIKLYVGLLQRGASDKRPQYLQTLQREVKRLEGLIENLLSLSRLDMGQPPLELEVLEVNEVVRQLLHDRTSLINERSLTVQTMLAADLPRARASLKFVSQILSNLITNATQYTPPGGQISVSTAVREHHDQSWITFTVKDTGPGIDAEDMPRLFERFYRGAVGRQSGAPGTGLGLAICSDLATQLGGRITIDSHPGQGAAFTVWLRPTEE